MRQRHQAKKNDCTLTQAGVFSDPDQGSHSSAQHSNESHICPERRSEQGGQLVGVSQYPPRALPRAAQYLLGGDPGHSPSTAPSVRQRHRATDQSTEEHPEKADFATREGHAYLNDHHAPSKQSQGGHPSAMPSVRQRHQAENSLEFSDPSRGVSTFGRVIRPLGAGPYLLGAVLQAADGCSEGSNSARGTAPGSRSSR